MPLRSYPAVGTIATIIKWEVVTVIGPGLSTHRGPTSRQHGWRRKFLPRVALRLAAWCVRAPWRVVRWLLDAVRRVLAWLLGRLGSVRPLALRVALTGVAVVALLMLSIWIIAAIVGWGRWRFARCPKCGKRALKQLDEFEQLSAQVL